MKILLINNCFWRRGGSEAVFFNTADLLITAGHEVVFLGLDDQQNIKTGQKEYFVKRGKAVKNMIAYFSNKVAAKVVEEILEKEKPDIAHAHLLWGGMTASIIPVLHKHGVPLVHTAHDYRMVCPAYTFRNGKGEVCEMCKGGKFWKCTKNRCSKGSFVQSLLMTLEMFYRNRKWHPAKSLDGIIYVSEFSKKKHDEIDPRFVNTNSTVLYNFTKIGEDYPMKEKDEGYYLYYGRLSGEKGVATLLKVFAHHPELTLKVVGTGPLEEDLKSQYPSTRTAIGAESDICTSGSTGEAGKCYENIQFLGFHSGGALAELVRSARYVCVPSEWYENNPMTIVEAYSMGVPVIGARIGGIPEIVDEGKTGFLFESGNVESLDKVICESVKETEDEYAQMKRNALFFSQEHFNAQTYPERLVEFYKKVIRDYKNGKQND